MKTSVKELKENNLYISGVPASEDDVKAGRAVFAMNPVGIPIDVMLPQYAWHHDRDTQTESLWIIIQAEENGGVQIFGAVNPEDGTVFAGTANEFKLIGESLHN